MERPCCDFCGDSRTFQEYPTNHAAVNWYAWSDCARLIDAEHWEQLIERSLTAYRQVRPIHDGEQPILRKHVEQLTEAFRAFRLAAA
jgi:Ser/Thr protein kinase RdoA (MazF antagonist)